MLTSFLLPLLYFSKKKKKTKHTDISQHYDANTKVVEFVPPLKLREIIDLSLPQQGCKLSPDLSGEYPRDLTCVDH